MTDKDLELLELLLEDFCKKSEMCQKCSCRHQDNNRYYCFFGLACIYKQAIKELGKRDKK